MKIAAYRCLLAPAFPIVLPDRCDLFRPLGPPRCVIVGGIAIGCNDRSVKGFWMRSVLSRPLLDDLCCLNLDKKWGSACFQQ